MSKSVQWKSKPWLSNWGPAEWISVCPPAYQAEATGSFPLRGMLQEVAVVKRAVPREGTGLPAAQLLGCLLWFQPQFSTDYRLAAVNYPSQINPPWHATSGKAFLGNWCTNICAFSPLLLSSKLPREYYLLNAKIKLKMHSTVSNFYLKKPYSIAIAGIQGDTILKWHEIPKTWKHHWKWLIYYQKMCTSFHVI